MKISRIEALMFRVSLVFLLFASGHKCPAQTIVVSGKLRCEYYTWTGARFDEQTTRFVVSYRKPFW